MKIVLGTTIKHVNLMAFFQNGGTKIKSANMRKESEIMFTMSEEEFIELRYEIKQNLENVKTKLKNIDIEIKDITMIDTILVVKDNLLGVEFNLRIDNYFSKVEISVLDAIMNNLLDRIQRLYLRK